MVNDIFHLHQTTNWFSSISSAPIQDIQQLGMIRIGES